jgi:hypothetical protein
VLVGDEAVATREGATAYGRSPVEIVAITRAAGEIDRRKCERHPGLIAL